VFRSAAWLTFQILVLSAVFSLLIGLLLGQLLMSKRWYVRGPVRVWVELFRLTPLLLQIVLIFFLLPIFTGHTLAAFTAGVIALSLNYGAFFSEVFRAGVTSLGKGQREAAAAMGMNSLQALRRVIYPQAIRRMLPPLTNMMVNLTKDTSLLTLIGVAELFNVAQGVAANNFRTIEVLIYLAGYYLVVNIPLSILSNRLYARQMVRI
jgi:His/Glu/Gln/Arg/opine family amino acid ABC transporter permease subunit